MSNPTKGEKYGIDCNPSASYKARKEIKDVGPADIDIDIDSVKRTRRLGPKT